MNAIFITSPVWSLLTMVPIPYYYYFFSNMSQSCNHNKTENIRWLVPSFRGRGTRYTHIQPLCMFVYRFEAHQHHVESLLKLVFGRHGQFWRGGRFLPHGGSGGDPGDPSDPGARGEPAGGAPSLPAFHLFQTPSCSVPHYHLWQEIQEGLSILDPTPNCKDSPTE